MHGFGRVCYLDALTPADVEELGHSGWDKAIMLRALKKTQVASLRQRMTWAGSVLAPPDAPAPTVARLKALETWEDISWKIEVTAVASWPTGPTKSVAQLMKAKQNGADVNGHLDQRALMSRRVYGVIFHPCPVLQDSVLALLRLLSAGVRGRANATTQAELGHPEVPGQKVGTTGNDDVYHVRKGCKALELSPRSCSTRRWPC